jgi:hypothetical protein
MTVATLITKSQTLRDLIKTIFSLLEQLPAFPPLFSKVSFRNWNPSCPSIQNLLLPHRPKASPPHQFHPQIDAGFPCKVGYRGTAVVKGAGGARLSVPASLLVRHRQSASSSSLAEHILLRQVREDKLESANRGRFRTPILGKHTRIFVPVPHSTSISWSI